MTQPRFSKQRIGLLATEMTTRGGVQSFMLRVSELISGAMEEEQAVKGYCVSLNDSTDAMRQHAAIPDNLDVWGAMSSKRRLLVHVFTKVPKTEVLFVGHLGAGPVAYLLKVLGRVREYYVILHGIEAWKSVTPLKRLALLDATKIIVTTRYTAEECGRLNGIPADRFSVIPLCADERLVSPSPDFNLKGEFRLLCVARQDSTERLKGIEHILEVLSSLRITHPHLHLNLVGDGNDQSRYRGIAANLGLTDQVTFWGRLPDEELAAAYQQCDIFVMPSKKEGFGIVFLEAMRHGKPCVGGNHGGTPDVIEHERSGYLVNYGDVKSLANIIRRLADDEGLKREMGLAGKVLVETKFSRSAFKAAYFKLISASGSAK